MLKLSSSKTKTTVSERRLYQFSDPKLKDFKVEEIKVNGEITSQLFMPRKVNVTHPFTYNQNLFFTYYANVDFLKEISIRHSLDIPEQTIIPDITTLKAEDIQNVLAMHLSMDGNIYQLTSPYPLPIWRFRDYIGGFTNKEFFLEPLAKYLKSISWIKDVEIIEIPYYNTSEGETKAVEFSFKCPPHIIKKICDKQGKFRVDSFGLQGWLNGVSPFKLKPFLKPKRKDSETIWD